MSENLLSVDAVARRLSISVWRVFQLVREKDKDENGVRPPPDLRSLKLGQRRLIPESALTEYLDKLQAVQTAPTDLEDAASA